MPTMRIPLRIVFYEEGGNWIAHSLEFDLVGAGEDKESAFKILGEAIGIQFAASLRTGNINNLFRPAESESFRKFFEGKDIAKGTRRITINPPASKGVKFEKAHMREWRPETSPVRRISRVLV